MRLSAPSFAAAALAAAWFLPVSAVSVQAQSPPGPAAPSATAPDLSDRKLDAAAAALQRVASLQQDYRQRVAEAQAQAEKDRIVAEANNALTKAVTDQGLSVEEYAAILNAARNDLEVRGKILQRIQPPDK
jgi:hypothetical protein